MVARRKSNYNAITEELSGHPELQLVFPECGDSSAPYVVPVVTARADAAYARMRSLGLPVFRWDRIWPGTPQYSSDATATWSRGLLQIACHQSLGGNQITRMCRALLDCVRA